MAARQMGFVHPHEVREPKIGDTVLATVNAWGSARTVTAVDAYAVGGVWVIDGADGESYTSLRDRTCGPYQWCWPEETKVN